MRIALIAAAGLATAIIGAAPSRADIEYPYCAIAGISTGPDCSYATLDQCRAFVSGVGTACTPNPRFRGYSPYSPRVTHPLRR